MRISGGSRRSFCTRAQARMPRSHGRKGASRAADPRRPGLFRPRRAGSGPPARSRALPWARRTPDAPEVPAQGAADRSRPRAPCSCGRSLHAAPQGSMRPMQAERLKWRTPNCGKMASAVASAPSHGFFQAAPRLANRGRGPREEQNARPACHVRSEGGRPRRGGRGYGRVCWPHKEGMGCTLNNYQPGPSATLSAGSWSYRF